MISVTISRQELESKFACSMGRQFFEDVLSLCGPKAREKGRIFVKDWTPLHDVWIRTSAGKGFAYWLQDQRIIPSADLSSADLRSADLSSADLSSADLRSADLRSADLCSANLSSADLSSADLTRAYVGSGSSAPSGWRTDATGYLEKDA